jgi:hypothetical protein
MAFTKGNPEPSTAQAGTGKGEQSSAQNAEADIWDEERMEQALKISKEMHIQVGY